MRNRLIVGVATLLVAATAAVAAAPYINTQIGPAQAHEISSERGSWMAASAPLPLLSRPAPAKPATEAPKADEPAKKAPAAKPAKRAKATAANAPKARRTGGSKQAQAERILASLIRRHPILKGTTVTFGTTKSGAQAEAYYQSGRIVVSPDHRRSLEVILTHEVWHVIDWRDNHRIDWGERIPPRYEVQSKY